MFMINLIGFPVTKLKDLVAEWDEKPYRAHQIFTWVYHQGVMDFDAMTNLSKELRERLKEFFYVGFPKILNKTVSVDGTIKYLFHWRTATPSRVSGYRTTGARLSAYPHKSGVGWDALFVLPQRLG